MTSARVVALAWWLVPALATAGGTLELAEVEPLLRQQPAVAEFLTSTLDLDHTVMAAVRLGSHFQHLGGARMGPYMIEARPKGSPAGKPVEVVLCTSARFLDDSGTESKSDVTAARLEEKLTAVMLREVGAQPAMPVCPDVDVAQ